ncbi:proline dehydrogenase family protein [Haloplanus halophilus]|uniref:proline dehydrogenase family protein n=1 Tax=Haloplanus halophilus TaxID=2949993 RepID=UPI00203F5DB8|nr:proline dehydrogenase family protein [Haloplanus sp. GDY1]
MLPPIADRFVAGETADGAVEHVRSLAADGIGGIVNHLGEHHETPEAAAADADAYLTLVERLADADVTPHPAISIKPSQVGLGVDEDCFRRNLDRVVDAAADAGVFVWLDMEDHGTTDATIDAYEALSRTHPGGVGVCLQANLRRTPDDVARLADTDGAIRLVKGAYDEPADLAHRDRAAVDAAYRDLLRRLFADCTVGVAVATHDEALIELAADLGARHDRAFEFQMLMGVREGRQRELAATHRVAQYVPYGSAWAAYFYRRVRERRENLAFAVRAVLSSLRS